jgi:pimeloyl-ACP methyl ester carboxylesterase
MQQTRSLEGLWQAAVTVTLLLTCGVSSGGHTSLDYAPVGAQAADEAAQGGPAQPAACRDTTPHDVTFVEVEPGVRLQVLDWGGTDKPRTMVLLTGLGDSAHVYDQFAFQFTDDFHVLGITRRGFLPSSQPDPGPHQAGYDVDTRARDDIAVLDALGITKAVFVGHSVAASELSQIALKYPTYVDQLVYLDAFDLSERFQLPELPDRPYTDADARSVQLFIAANQRLEDILKPAPAVCLGVQFDDHGVITGTTSPASVSQAILLGVQVPANPPTDWAAVAAPRLGVFSQPSVEGKLPFYWYLSAEDQQQFDANWPAIVDWYRHTTDEFAVPHAGRPAPVVHRLPDAPHYFHLSNHQAFVVRVMRESLLGDVGPVTPDGRLND